MEHSYSVCELLKQAQNEQEINFEGKIAEETAELIKNMFKNMPEDHPLKANIKKG